MNSAAFRYVPDRALRVSMQRDPELAEWRRQFARVIWKARREHPGMDKLLWRAYCDTRRTLADKVFGGL